MFLSLQIPDFALQAWQLAASAPDPAACLGLLDSTTLPQSSSAQKNTRLLHWSPAAGRFQLFRGMRVSHALGRCPDLQVLTRRPDLEQEAQRHLLELALGLSPDVEDGRDGHCLVRLSGSPGFRQNGVDWILEQAPPDAIAPLSVHYGVAASPELAYLAARLSQSERPLRHLQDSHELNELPVQVLEHFLPREQSHDFLSLLALWGIHRLGDFMQLCPQQASARLGAQARRLHHLLSSFEPRPLKELQPEAAFFIHHDLDTEIDSLDRLLFLLKSLLSPLCQELTQKGLVATAIELTLYFHDEAPHERHLRVARPHAEASALHSLLGRALESLRLPAPITRLRLGLSPAPAAHWQADAFDQSLKDPNQLQQTLARIESLVGHGHIGIPAPNPGHHPDHFQIRPWQHLLERAKPSQAQELTAPGWSLPLHRYRPPKAIEVKSRRDSHPAQPLEILSGPYRGRIIECSPPRHLSGQWWDPKQRWKQIQWEVRLAAAPLLRLSQTTRGWQLDGYFC